MKPTGDEGEMSEGQEIKWRRNEERKDVRNWISEEKTSQASLKAL